MEGLIVFLTIAAMITYGFTLVVQPDVIKYIISSEKNLEWVSFWCGAVVMALLFVFIGVMP